MEDIDLALFCGVDIPIPECQIILHPPSLKEISMIGEKIFLRGITILSLDKEQFNEGKVDLSNTSNFKIFMTIMQSEEGKEQKKAVKEAFSLLVPNSKLSFTPRSLLLNYNSSNVIIDESNFEFLQKVIKQAFCLEEKQSEKFNPADKNAARIAERMKQTRKEVARRKGDDVGSIYARYASAISVGLHLPLNIVNAYTIYQIRDILERYSLWMDYDIDMKSRLAGADIKGKPIN